MNIKFLLPLIAGLALVSFAPAALGQYANIAAAVAGETQISVALNGALAATNLTSTFQNDLNVTLFAPSDAALLNALAQFGFSQNAIAANAGPMKPLLYYHVLNYSVTTDDFPDNAFPTFLTGVNKAATLDVRQIGANTYQVNSMGSDATIIKANITAGMGTVHIIDGLLLPFFINFASGLTRLAPLFGSIVGNASTYAPRLVASLANPKLELTFFLPTDSGMIANSAAVSPFMNTAGMNFFLHAHIVPKPVIQLSSITTTPVTVTTLAGVNLTLARAADGNVTVTSSTGVVATIRGVPGVGVGFTPSGVNLGQLLIVDKPLIPTAKPATLFAVRSDLNTLTTAVNTEGTYASVFNGTTAFGGSLLVPTDAAFSAFLTAQGITASQLLADKEALRKLLAIHVVNGTALYALTLVNNQTVSTYAGGNTLTVVISGLDIAFKATSTSSAKVIGNKDYAVGMTATAFAIDAVLVPSGWTLSQGGAASIAAPSPLGLLFSGLLAFALLHIFGKH